MAFSRSIEPRGPQRGAPLTAAMIGIGMNFAGDGDASANIEDTLLAASIEGLEHDDLRTLSVLTTWLTVHLAFVNADRLIQLVRRHQSRRVAAYWTAVARWPTAGHRFARIARWSRKERQDLLAVGTKFQVGRFGEHPLFENGPLCVPANALRNRPEDVLTPQLLARRHGAYRARVMMGPSYRADMWAALDRDPSASVSEIARTAYGSIATASAVKKHWAVIQGRAESAAP